MSIGSALNSPGGPAAAHGRMLKPLEPIHRDDIATIERVFSLERRPTDPVLLVVMAAHANAHGKRRGIADFCAHALVAPRVEMRGPNFADAAAGMGQKAISSAEPFEE